MARKSTKPPNGKLIDVLHACSGNVTAAAESIGYSYVTFYKWIKMDKSGKLQAAVEQGREKILDLAEGVIEKKLKAGHVEAAKFMLRYKGRSRGYYLHDTVDEKIEGALKTDTKIDGDINVTVCHRIINNRDDLDNLTREIAPPTVEELLLS